MSSDMKNEPYFISQWKEEMRNRLKIRFRGQSLSEKKINKYLDKVIEKNLQNPKIRIENTYLGAEAYSDLLSLIDSIEQNQLIIGGGGVLFLQHNTPGKDNVLYNYIVSLQDARDSQKAERKKYDKLTDLWIMFDILQNNTKKKVVIRHQIVC